MSADLEQTHVTAKFAEENMTKLMVVLLKKLGLASVTLTLADIHEHSAMATPDDMPTLILPRPSGRDRAEGDDDPRSAAIRLPGPEPRAGAGMSVETLLEAVKKAAKARQQPGADDVTQTIGEALEAKRKELGFNNREFAVVLGISDRHYPEIVRGDRALTMALARRAFALGVSAKVILG